MWTRYKKALINNFSIGLVGSLGLVLTILLFLLPEIESSSKQRYYEQPKIAVENALGIIKFYHAQEKAGTLSPSQAKDFAKEAIRQIRYKGNEYFWINSIEPRMVMHPFKPELEGKDLTSVKDPNGKKIFVEMVRVTSNNPSGFVDYLWPMQGQTEPVPKTSFVSKFEPWGWIVGSGIYLDKMELSIANTRRKSLLFVGLGVLFLLVVNLIFSIKTVKQFNVPISYAVKDLNHNSRDLISQTKKLTQNSSVLSSNVQAQSSAIHELTQTVQMINSTSESTLLNSEKSTERANTSKSLIERCQVLSVELNQGVQEVIGSQNDMMGLIEDNFSAIEELDKRFEDITASVSLINDIVFQTKLLSFNASVEAQRAGEAGKGFAVVASEVGKLALSSGESAHSISEVIVATQQHIKSLIADSKKKASLLATDIDKKITQAKTSIDGFSEIFDDVLENSNELVKNQAQNHEIIQEQNSAMDAMVEAIKDLETKNSSNDQLAQDNNLSAKELDKFTSNLDGLVEKLDGLANRDAS